MYGNDVMILSSGVGLGVYVPALLIQRQLAKYVMNAEVHLIENLLPDEKKAKIDENKKAFQKNFAFAIIGQKLARDIVPLLDGTIVNDLLNTWLHRGICNFVVLSGFWVPIIERYKKMIFPKKVFVDVCHMDAVTSTSWKIFKKEVEQYNNIWFYSLEKNKVLYELPVPCESLIPYNQRQERYVMHGGGWGIGTYLQKIPNLEKQGLRLDIVLRDKENIVWNKNNTYFMLNPYWSPFKKCEFGIHTFPPLGEIKNPETTEYIFRKEYHGLFDVISRSKAIISKPGGATLMDSLVSTTPLIFLEPLGYYENSNAKLWEKLQLGVSYQVWEESGFSTEMLEKLHFNILEVKQNSENYITDYLERLG